MLSFKEHILLETVLPRKKYTLAGKKIRVKTNTDSVIIFKVAQSRTSPPVEGKPQTYVHAFTHTIGGISHIVVTSDGDITYPSDVVSFKVIK